MNHVTMRDVAREAGVSVNTVSRALAGKPDVSPQTRAKVLEVAERLGYRPNKLARGLRSNKTFTLGVIVTDIANPFFAELVKGVEETARKNGYSILLEDTSEDPKKEEKAIQVMLAERVDGLLVTPVQSTRRALEEVLKSGFPFVLMGRYFPDLDAPYVVTDDVQGAIIAVEHLINLGHRKIAHVAGPLHISSAQDRLSGYIKALERHGITVREEYILKEAVTLEDGYRAGKELLQLRPLPSAVFAYSDFVAVGIMQAILEEGFRIPADISLVGYDDILFSAYTKVPLTTIRIPKRTLGSEAVRMLLKSLARKKSLSAKAKRLGVDLVVRDSTGRKGVR
ncbi:MAG: Transcriptional regulator, LacI family [Acetothermia bacterium 64_32]|nr:MAG: Transcriptional regulator, LacI family [Acetothermia bacterium 64_32]HAF70985.1 LacI family transcriptional regulator [Candidatus Acetothermia bacterium]